MKKVIALFLLAGLSLYSIAQKTINDPNAEKRTVGSFHAIEVSDGIDLYLSQGGEAVAVSATETKYRDRIHTEVKDGVLKIWYERLNISLTMGEDKRKLKAYVSCSSLDALKASSGADVLVDGTIQSSKLAIHLSSGADFDGKVSVSELTVDQSSGADIKISGKANSLTVTSNSGADFHGFDLETDNCTVKASSGSDISVTVNKQLDATSHSGADIRYKGNAEVKSDKSIGAKIKKVS